MFPIKRPSDNDKTSFAILNKKSKTIKLPPKAVVQKSTEPLEPLPITLISPLLTLSPILPITPITPILPVTPPTLPFKFIDDIDRENAFGQIEDWIKASLKSSQKPLLIAGHTGSGKTTLIQHYFIKHLLELPETYDENGSTREEKHDDCTDFLRPSGLLRRRLPAVFDNIESYDLVVRDVLRSALGQPKRRSFVMTTDDIFIEPAKSFAKQCIVVRLDNPRPSFVTKVLKSRREIDTQVVQSIIEVSNGNLANALNCLEVINNSTDASQMFQDRPMDVPKATRCALIGEDIPLLGGSSDTSFLGIMLQVNCCQVPQPVGQLARTLDRYSFLNVVDAVEPDKKLTTEQLWLLIQKTYGCSAKLQKNSRFNLDWPRSLTASKNPWLYGGYFYE